MLITLPIKVDFRAKQNVQIELSILVCFGKKIETGLIRKNDDVTWVEHSMFVVVWRRTLPIRAHDFKAWFIDVLC